MDLPSIRRNNLQAIIRARFGGNASAFGRAIDRSQSQVSDLLAGRKSFGEKTARYIEERLGVVRYMLDQPTMRLEDQETLRMIADVNKLNARNLGVLRVMLDGLLAGQTENHDNDTPLNGSENRDPKTT